MNKLDISLRDEFAKACLQGLMANPQYEKMNQNLSKVAQEKGELEKYLEDWKDVTVKMCYEFADAMMYERIKQSRD